MQETSANSKPEARVFLCGCCPDAAPRPGCLARAERAQSMAAIYRPTAVASRISKTRHSGEGEVIVECAEPICAAPGAMATARASQPAAVRSTETPGAALSSPRGAFLRGRLRAARPVLPECELTALALALLFGSAVGAAVGSAAMIYGLGR